MYIFCPLSHLKLTFASSHYSLSTLLSDAGCMQNKATQYMHSSSRVRFLPLNHPLHCHHNQQKQQQQQQQQRASSSSSSSQAPRLGRRAKKKASKARAAAAAAAAANTFTTNFGSSASKSIADDVNSESSSNILNFEEIFGNKHKVSRKTSESVRINQKKKQKAH